MQKESAYPEGYVDIKQLCNGVIFGFWWVSALWDRSHFNALFTSSQPK